MNSFSDQRSIIRELATRVAQIAASDENQKAKQRWRDVNALRKPDRAPVWCRPVGAWAELLAVRPSNAAIPACAAWKRVFAAR